MDCAFYGLAIPLESPVVYFRAACYKVICIYFIAITLKLYGYGMRILYTVGQYTTHGHYLSTPGKLEANLEINSNPPAIHRS